MRTIIPSAARVGQSSRSEGLLPLAVVTHDPALPKCICQQDMLNIAASLQLKALLFKVEPQAFVLSLRRRWRYLPHFNGFGRCLGNCCWRQSCWRQRWCLGNCCWRQSCHRGSCRHPWGGAQGGTDVEGCLGCQDDRRNRDQHNHHQHPHHPQITQINSDHEGGRVGKRVWGPGQHCKDTSKDNQLNT
jgi:hypothetical protein